MYKQGVQSKHLPYFVSGVVLYRNPSAHPLPARLPVLFYGEFSSGKPPVKVSGVCMRGVGGSPLYTTITHPTYMN
tara:strand:+ start:356 stop:580 length:225 start_codon:yes stop_codon:yes gene_type:complete